MLSMLELCAGYGGFSLAFAGVARSVCFVERDAHAASVLVARMQDGALPQAPIWDDLSTFDGRPWRGRVDLVTAGFPCQPFSSAGQRRGVDDDRWLWPEIARIVAEVGPGLVILENVPGVVRHGLPEVLHDLAQLGFDAQWGLYSAAAVGAPHKRERFWLLAYTDRDGLAQFGWQPYDDWHTRHDADGSGGAHVAESDSARLEGRRVRQHEPAQRGRADVADAARLGRDEGQRPAARYGRAEPAAGHRFPPRPDDDTGWAEWIAAGGPQPQLRRRLDGATGRLVRPAGLADRLHLLGNGLVPQCATEAIHQLARRALT